MFAAHGLYPRPSGVSLTPYGSAVTGASATLRDRPPCSPRRLAINSLSARDQLIGDLVGGELREARPDRPSGLIRLGGKRVGDRAEAPARLGQVHVGHRAQELVAAESDDQVV